MTWRNIPNDSNFHQQYCESIVSSFQFIRKFLRTGDFSKKEHEKTFTEKL